MVNENIKNSDIGLPWRISEQGADVVDGPVIVDRRNCEVLGVSEWARIGEDHLNHIVTASNSHLALVDALSDAVRWLKGQPERSSCNVTTLHELIEKAEAALNVAR